MTNRAECPASLAVQTAFQLYNLDFMKNAILGLVTIWIMAGGVTLLHADDSTGFRFLGGDADEGKIAFERLGCIRCHKVKGAELANPKGKRLLNLSLGEEIRFVKRYEDIVTAITNPQHVVTKQYSAMLSKAEIDGEITAFMPDLTKDMSVRQLMNLATFLDKAYSTDLEGYQKPVKK